MSALLVNTPHYVLLNGKQRLGPEVLPTHNAPHSVAIYGFSDKPPYDLFCANCELALTPYPLVKGYLKDQITDSGDALHLVVVDAEGPNEARLNAVTMNSVLKAMEQKSNWVTIAFRLMMDQESRAYRVENTCSEPGEIHRPAEKHGA